MATSGANRTPRTASSILSWTSPAQQFSMFPLGEPAGLRARAIVWGIPPGMKPYDTIDQNRLGGGLGFNSQIGTFYRLSRFLHRTFARPDPRSFQRSSCDAAAQGVPCLLEPPGRVDSNGGAGVCSMVAGK